MNALDLILSEAEKTCPDIKVLYTLWLENLTIQVMDKRTGKTHTRTFAGADSNVTKWLTELQQEV